MVYIILGKGFEETEAVVPYDLLRRSGVPVCYAGIGGTVIEGSLGTRICTDITLDEVDLSQLDMLVLPGGLGGVHSILDSEQALALTKKAYESGKYIAAICAAPTILARLGITEGRSATCYPGMEHEMGGAKMLDANAVIDGKIITGRAAGAAMDFGLALSEVLAGEETMRKVKNGVVFQGGDIRRITNE